MSDVPLIVLTAGEPAGIGPDLILMLTQKSWEARLCVIADPVLLKERAALLGLDSHVQVLKTVTECPLQTAGIVSVWPVPLVTPCKPSQLNSANSAYVIQTLAVAAALCLDGTAAAMVTAPVHKGIINDAGIRFQGHTEFFAQQSQVDQVVMMLATPGLRVALATTHLPIKDVADAITQPHLTRCIKILHADLLDKLQLAQARILVAGLNPHAGENGHIGREEIEVIEPVIADLQAQGYDVQGPFSADTLFTPQKLTQADAILCMYHDQGLPVLKHKGFGQAANITLGLPFVRTSVDHGTALSLAGSGDIDIGSLHYALRVAIDMGKK